MFRIEARGVVQGVGFRPSVKRAADILGARGFVRNDGSHVTIECDIDPEKLLKKLESILGPMARIESWDIIGLDPKKEIPPSFEIIASTEGERDSSLPPDTAICESCLKEMSDPENRRYLYPFTNCTDCGARYTLIEGLPYDRERTSMREFTMCNNCKEEYSDQTFRRFHAQTLSCPENGPTYRLMDRQGNLVNEGYRAFLGCADMISSGGIVIVKGWGGMHIVCDPARMKLLRKWYSRPYKPFAIMSRDLTSAKKLAEVPDYVEKILLSPARPIMLVKKRNDLAKEQSRILDLASPGLGTVGIYLPYSGIHHLLFKALKDNGSGLESIVMTSANPPGEPMAVDLENAFKMKADGYLVHDRRISARCDDSVLVPNPFDPDTARSLPGPFSIRSFPIRKARGLIPDPVDLPHEKGILAFGAERNVTVTVSVRGRGFTSPYVGNSRHPEVLDYASESAERLMALFGGQKIEAVSADLHPRYETIPLAREFAERFDVPLHRYQHHEAHAASLMVDSDLCALPVLVLDGVGHGRDGLPWGGEIIGSSWDLFERLGSLETFGLPGGDSSVYHPERIAHWISIESGIDLDIHDEAAASILSKTHARAVSTTSFGRLLDALSSLLLGITWRTYDGEPAMRLESLLDRSKNPETSLFSVPLKGNQVNVTGRWKILVEELFGNDNPAIGRIPDQRNTPDLVMGMVGSILDDMVEISLVDNKGDSNKKPYVGISGGVAYDLPIVRYFVRSCREHGAFPVLHSRVPPGDGGISVGQAALAGLELEKAGNTPQT